MSETQTVTVPQEVYDSLLQTSARLAKLARELCARPNNQLTGRECNELRRAYTAAMNSVCQASSASATVQFPETVVQLELLRHQ